MPEPVTSLTAVRQAKDKLKVDNTTASALLGWVSTLYAHKIVLPPSYQTRKSGAGPRTAERSPLVVAHAMLQRQCLGCAHCGKATGLSGEALPQSGAEWVLWSPPVKYIPHTLRTVGVLFLLCHPCVKVLAQTSPLWEEQADAPVRTVQEPPKVG